VTGTAVYRDNTACMGTVFTVIPIENPYFHTNAYYWAGDTTMNDSTQLLKYRVGQKTGLFFRLDNFVTISPRKACSMSKLTNSVGK